MNLERMAHLLTIMEKVRDEEKPFDMEEWIKAPPAKEERIFDKIITKTLKSLFNAEIPKENPWCGTTCCALGHAALDPKFSEEGLGIEVNFGDEICVSVTSIDAFAKVVREPINKEGIGTKDGKYGAATVFFGEWFGIFAAEKFFDIKESTAHWLFNTVGYYNEDLTNPDIVIERIQQCLDKGEPEIVFGDEDGFETIESIAFPDSK